MTDLKQATLQRLQSDEVVQTLGSVTTDRDAPSDTNKHVPLWHSIKKWPKIVGYCLALSSAILLYGFDFVIVGTVSAMPEFQHVFGRELHGRYIIPSVWLSLWTLASNLGMMPGAVLGGRFQDSLGRRWSLLAGAVFSAVAVAICYVSDQPETTNGRRGVFFVGKLVQGYAIGMMLTVAQTWMSEVLPTLLRGPIIAFFPIFTLLGQLVGAVVVDSCLKYQSATSYRICFATQWPFSIVAFLTSLFLPESPTWLLRNSRIDDAMRSQKRLDTDRVDSEAIIDELRIAILKEEESCRANKVSYRDCFKGTHRRRTYIVMWASCLPELFGLVLMSNASYFMEIVGMGSTDAIAFLILGIGLGLIANVVSLWSLNRFGRRQLSLWSLAITTVLWMGMGIAGCFSGIVMIWYTAITMMCIVIVVGVAVWPASHVISAESSSLQLRAVTQGVGWFISSIVTAIMSATLPFIYNVGEGDLRAKTGFVMAGFTVVSYIGTWYLVPEMKARTPMEIDRMFDLQLPTRQFRHWQSDVGILMEETKAGASVA